jgi:hypothetical protein
MKLFKYLIQYWILKKLNNYNETKKFWSFKDTKNYKTKKTISDNVIRTFVFEKSFLLQVLITDRYTQNEEELYVIPLTFVSRKFPYGNYIGIGKHNTSIHFSDENILRVIS